MKSMKKYMMFVIFFLYVVPILAENASSFSEINVKKLSKYMDNNIENKLNILLDEIVIPPSKERVALRMLYHKNPNNINEVIINALKKGDRKKVYDEIKYTLKEPKIADIFGEFD